MPAAERALPGDVADALARRAVHVVVGRLPLSGGGDDDAGPEVLPVGVGPHREAAHTLLAGGRINLGPDGRQLPVEEDGRARGVQARADDLVPRPAVVRG
ncbi:hypothetical protein ITI46_28795 [Streptomyces oryzae]|uniref:Uncharacterized protein n=1 Tax=Streptomyces oryzae TaxID=1434886 RepID=A0ABS3XJR5_9ACTN|nr:hypothetical protein [Streptomyces oryzae]MBO8195619.1 hypothetical protein [Streptomyces oryzae]